MAMGLIAAMYDDEEKKALVDCPGDTYSMVGASL
jgi:hypothetical protein